MNDMKKKEQLTESLISMNYGGCWRIVCISEHQSLHWCVIKTKLQEDWMMQEKMVQTHMWELFTVLVTRSLWVTPNRWNSSSSSFPSLRPFADLNIYKIKINVFMYEYLSIFIDSAFLCLCQSFTLTSSHACPSSNGSHHPRTLCLAWHILALM